MYAGDSFFTLTLPGQAGLVLLSLLLGGGMLWAHWRLPLYMPLILRMGIGLVGFFAFEWLSVQVYYQYYRLIFDGLPAQWVADLLRTLGTALPILSFSGDQSLSAHARGILGWAMVLLPLVRRYHAGKCRNAAN